MSEETKSVQDNTGTHQLEFSSTLYKTIVVRCRSDKKFAARVKHVGKRIRQKRGSWNHTLFDPEKFKQVSLFVEGDNCEI